MRRADTTLSIEKDMPDPRPPDDVDLVQRDPEASERPVEKASPQSDAGSQSQCPDASTSMSDASAGKDNAAEREHAHSVDLEPLQMELVAGENWPPTASEWSAWAEPGGGDRESVPPVAGQSSAPVEDSSALASPLGIDERLSTPDNGTIAAIAAAVAASEDVTDDGRVAQRTEASKVEHVEAEPGIAPALPREQAAEAAVTLEVKVTDEAATEAEDLPATLPSPSGIDGLVTRIEAAEHAHFAVEIAPEAAEQDRAGYHEPAVADVTISSHAAEVDLGPTPVDPAETETIAQAHEWPAAGYVEPLANPLASADGAAPVVAPFDSATFETPAPAPLGQPRTETSAAEPAAPAPLPVRTYRAHAWRVLRLAGYVVGGYIAFAMALTVMYRFVNPPFSALMIYEGLFGRGAERSWVSLEEISPHLVRAVVVAEDGRFCDHHGIDLAAIREAIEKAGDGVPRGASTISMQVTKNLFLWPSKSYLRKLIELPLTLFMELLWPKTRILEVYLNIAEWGPGVFGAEAAARHHFNRPASSLSEREAAQLAAALPNPIRRDAGDPGPRLQRKASIIQKRARSSGSAAHCVLQPR